MSMLSLVILSVVLLFVVMAIFGSLLGHLFSGFQRF